MPGTISDALPPDVAEFLENSVLDVIVPADSQLDLKKSLEEWDGETGDEDSHLPSFIEQRPFLLLDEVVDAYVVLQTPVVSEDVLNILLSRLEINIEAWATGIPPPQVPRQGDPRANQPPPPVKEMLQAETVNTSEEPIVAASGAQSDDDESDSKQTMYLFWKVPISLARPRTRMQKIVLFFAVSGSLAPELPLVTRSADDYMPSGIPAAMNLLEPLSHDPIFADSKPCLSAVRITKVAPSSTATRQVPRPIRTSGQRKMYRAAPPLLWRIRYSKSASPPKTNDLIASFDFEITPFASADILITHITMSLSQGVVTPFGSDLPWRCKPGDQITRLYRLHPDPSLDELLSNESRKHQLSLHIKGEVLISDTCRPRLEISWSMPVDFSTQTKFGHSRTRSTLLNQSTSIEIPYGPPTGPGQDGRRRSSSTERPGTSHSMTTDSGVVITTSGPKEVRIGEVFTWKLFIINRSEALVRFAIFAVLRRRTPRRGDRLSLPIGQAEGGNASGGGDVVVKDKVGEPVVEPHLLHGLLKTGEMEPAELVCLTTDLRVGPLVPSACYSTEMEFLALAPGVLQVEALRVVDLNTQETTDIREVPDVIAVER